jgi:exosortase H (IPTLxxWG-CTERM-specific)
VARLEPSNPGQRDRARFAVVFVLLASSLLVLYYFPRGPGSTIEALTADYLRFYTRMVSLAVGLVDPGASAHGNVVSGRFTMQIVKSCDAMEANILFVAALMAFPAPWRRKSIAVVAGLSALVACNLARLIVLYWIGIYSHGVFEFAHYDVWPLLMIAFATVDFVVCARWVQGTEAEPVQAGADVTG